MDCFGKHSVIVLGSVINRRRGRAAVNRSQAGIRSRRRRLWRLRARASVDPLHESSSEAQSAKTGSDPTAARGLSAARLPKELVFQFSRKTSTTRPAICRSLSLHPHTISEQAPLRSACR